jgi:hypothetical protein
MNETEISAPVRLTLPDGSLNPDAVGWTRQPMHDTSGIGGPLRGRRARPDDAAAGPRRDGRGLRGVWGRDKRWEYWAVMTPRWILALTVSDIDYLRLSSVWLLDRSTGEEIERGSLLPAVTGGRSTPGALGATAGTLLPPSAEQGPARARSRGLRLALDQLDGAGGGAGDRGTRLRGWTPRVSFDLVADLPAGHERMGVVIPWRDSADGRGRVRRFQYTLKDVARPTRGWIAVDGVRHRVGGEAERAWAVLDHGRGRWPYRVQWNWAAGSGARDGRIVGLQLGAKWTDGSGATENALVVNGHVSKISEELRWDYGDGAGADPASSREGWMRPWRITGESADLTLTPFHHRHSAVNALALSQRADQVFGTWAGWVRDDLGERVRVDGIEGWAEDVLNRW